MSEGGKLTIETSGIELDEGYSHRHMGIAPGRYTMLTVSDTGVGIGDEAKEHLFEPFFTTKEFGKGNGLGLAAIQGVVKQSGGHILVYSEVGHGTTFKLYFPQVEVAPIKPVASETKPAETKGIETILVVEDEDVVRQVACDIIRQGGYKVIEATSAVAALEMCERSKEHIDLVLTDLIMPKMNGPELVKRLAGQHPKLGVVFMSGYTSEAVTSNGLLNSPAAFVQKPFMPKTLLQTIREVLDTRVN
jgi:two-component system cell cycle sensor histidine kinase/response regulator CckA